MTASPEASLPPVVAHWFESRGWAPRRHQLEMLAAARAGHSALLVHLASGPVLLSGDQYHFTEAVKNRGVPSFNTNRADTLASHDRFDRIANNTGAKVIIQHEPDDIAKLPAFPGSAK